MSETRLQGMCKLVNQDKHMGRRYARALCRLGDMYGKEIRKDIRREMKEPASLIDRYRWKIKRAERKKHITLLLREIIIVDASKEAN